MAGYDTGKEAYRIGGTSRFYESGSYVWDQLDSDKPVVVDPDSLDFARGYLDGYERAREQSHKEGT